MVFRALTTDTPEAILAGLSIWPGPPEIRAIAAGYTNRNFRVDSGDQSFFARVAPDLPAHGISRAQEAICTRLAAQLGVGPEVVCTDHGTLVTRYVVGIAFCLDRPAGTNHLLQIGQLLRTVHAAPFDSALAPVDFVAICRKYLERLDGNAIVLRHRTKIDQLIADAPRLELRHFVHGDTFPENFIDDGQRIWLVDWEYAGRGDPAVDLALIAMNWQLSDAQIETLVAGHGGLIAWQRVRQLVPLAALRDALWCLVECEQPARRLALDSYARRCWQRLGIRFAN